MEHSFNEWNNQEMPAANWRTHCPIPYLCPTFLFFLTPISKQNFESIMFLPLQASCDTSFRPLRWLMHLPLRGLRTSPT